MHHQMSFIGKFDGITLADLHEVGDLHLVPRHAGVTDEAFQAIDKCSDFAQNAGVSEKTTERIAKDIGLNRPR